ncbi:hypothetical protein K469DRAFT_195512 [Zopfia rhizophila CBS 207.26]|uniref:Uncharacterized protein n=1 Tax=Zopfia rhizophila CBS 207.26 TaxID=1314779 RepID=A0A6A6EQ28_9PEZI|nr:hypothetical protein K469DRAFT_195512 [Zopfia rhizophila CBS 207.26]
MPNLASHISSTRYGVIHLPIHREISRSARAQLQHSQISNVHLTSRLHPDNGGRLFLVLVSTSTSSGISLTYPIQFILSRPARPQATIDSLWNPQPLRPASFPGHNFIAVLVAFVGCSATWVLFVSLSLTPPAAAIPHSTALAAVLTTLPGPPRQGINMP